MTAPAIMMRKAVPIPTDRPVMTLLFSAPFELCVAGCVAVVAVELGGSDTVVVEVRAGIPVSSGRTGVVLDRFGAEAADVVELDVDDSTVEEADSESFARQPTKVRQELRKPVCYAGSKKGDSMEWTKLNASACVVSRIVNVELCEGRKIVLKLRNQLLSHGIESMATDVENV